MKKLSRYLAPYRTALLFCIVCLFIQAICDLNLPKQMARIVDVGIQQGGIEERIPKAVSSKSMELFGRFLPAQDASAIKEMYRLTEQGNAQAKEFPLSKTEAVWILSEQDTEKINRAAEAYESSAWTIVQLQAALPKQTGVQALHRLPASAVSQELLKEMQQSAVNADAAARKGAGLALTKQLYAELGVNLDVLRTQSIWSIGLRMLVITLAGVFAAVGVGFFAARISAGAARDLRKDVFRATVNFESQEFDEFSTASLITRSTNDVSQIQTMLSAGIRMALYAPIMGVGGIIMAVQNSTSMSWIIALGVIVLILLIGTVFTIVIPRFKRMQKLIDRLNLIARESLSGLFVIRAFGTEKYEQKRFEKSNRDLMENQLFVNRVMSLMMPLMSFLMNVLTLLIVWMGAHAIEQSTMQVGDMMAFMQYTIQIIMAFLMLSIMFIIVPRAAVSAERITEVLEVSPSIRTAEYLQKKSGKIRGNVEFRNVNFRYHNAQGDVLQHVSFVAEAGKITAFIGATGSGKSTLIQLIPRFYDVTSGQVLIDGRDVRDYPVKELRESIGFVPQKTILFSGTVESNLQYGAPIATEKELLRAAETAQASGFLASLPDGLQADISQGGVNVSGGQKQRLAIARALAKEAPIYIFDDSFSALDFKTDAALRKALRPAIKGATVLLVAQRVGTILDADRIVVLDEGKVVGIGTHRELLKNCPVYHEIAVSQLSEEELQ